MDAPDACVAPFGGSGTPGFTCGRFAGRLGAIFGAPRFTPGFPADGFGATSVDFAIVGAAFTAGLAAAFTDVGLSGAGLATALTTGFEVGFFVAGLFSVGAVKMRERRPFFSATGGHKLHKIRNSTAVAPLIVIPGDNLGEVITEEHGAR